MAGPLSRARHFRVSKERRRRSHARAHALAACIRLAFYRSYFRRYLTSVTCAPLSGVRVKDVGAALSKASVALVIFHFGG